MQKENIDLRREILLTFQVALLGMVDYSLRGVIVGWDVKRIYAHCYYECELTDIEYETASDIEAEVAASFPDYQVEVTALCKRMPSVIRPSEDGEVWVYKRRE